MKYYDTELNVDVVLQLESHKNGQKWTVTNAETGEELETISRAEYNRRQDDRYI